MNKKQELKELKQESERKTEMLNAMTKEIIRLNKRIKKLKEMK